MSSGVETLTMLLDHDIPSTVEACIATRDGTPGQLRR